MQTELTIKEYQMFILGAYYAMNTIIKSKLKIDYVDNKNKYLFIDAEDQLRTVMFEESNRIFGAI